MPKGVNPKEDVIRFVHDNDVEMVNLWFTDILGRLKSIGITRDTLETALQEGIGFDGSSVEGFVRIYESDLIALPDASTFQLFPWKLAGKAAGVMFCYTMNPDGTHYEGDPRYVLKRAVERAAEKGFSFNVGPELEYFYFRDSGQPTLLDVAGYFDVVPDDVGNELRQKTIFALQGMGIAVECGHHEVAPSQQEIDLRYAHALKMADQTMLYRYLVKEVAKQNGVYATFMPKPIAHENGSGMHTHQSLFCGDKNAFFDANGPYHLSQVARSYLGGLLTHAREIASVTNQWVNSYKRIVPGYEAPVYISWGQRNRSALVRVPMYKPGKEESTRLELRSPDPACNPYLAFAVMLAAGLRGIEGNYEAPAPIEEDIYHMSPEARAQNGIHSLPDSLYSAIQETEKSEVVRDALGEGVFQKFLNNKRVEWEDYCIQVTDYELQKYLPVL
ncbi:MAG: type I glutamate--ammonia ligase [Candidatus Eiseniibacteriota bacterium]|nr:MAG: type I glutamate--ammonia ligase [Candidatus Eisenbacteria bacterium]